LVNRSSTKGRPINNFPISSRGFRVQEKKGQGSRIALHLGTEP
jgi:hypothetical protein